MIIDSATMSGSKRKATGGMPPARRIKTTREQLASFALLNVKDGEVVHQACIQLMGSAPVFENSADDFILLRATDAFSVATNPTSWPSRAEWKALVHLKSGFNTVTLDLHHAGGISHSITTSINYQPLLQVPPLHLAVMVAQDSPLTIDCPAAKYGAVSSAHSSLDSVIEKFRTTAQMWQAVTAEQLHLHGQGRRCFRLEEEWSVPGRSVIKVHIVRTEKTVAQIHGMEGSDALHNVFLQALTKYGGPFQSKAKPAVAGLVLDARFCAESNRVLGFAKLGKPNPNGISLAMYSTHSTFSWPRSLLEVCSCLLDPTHLDDTVGCGRDNNCDTYQEACSLSQTSFLCEVGQAFGLGDNGLVNFRNDEWRQLFIPAEHGQKSKDLEMWTLTNALRLKANAQFRIPGDEHLTPEFCNANIRLTVATDSDGEDILEISCPGARLAHVTVKNGDSLEAFDLLKGKGESGTVGPIAGLSITDLASYSREMPMVIHAIATNGRTRDISNAWTFLADRPYITIPASVTTKAVTMHKFGVKETRLEQEIHKNGEQRTDEPDENVPWVVLLQKNLAIGTIVPATMIETCVGATFDGAIVHYSGGATANCGPKYRSPGQSFRFGGNKNTCQLPPGVWVTKVEVQKQYGCLDGIRITLSDGQIVGELNDRGQWGWGDDKTDTPTTIVLAPTEDERVVGFYGRSCKPNRGYTREFGILVAAKDDLSSESFLPEAVHELDCVKNSGRWEGDERSKKMRVVHLRNIHACSEDEFSDIDSNIDYEDSDHSDDEDSVGESDQGDEDSASEYTIA